MKSNSTTSKRKTLITQLTWMGALVVSIVLFVQCYEFTTLLQPQEGFTNTPFEVPVVIKQDGDSDFNNDLKDYGVFGIQIPEGWTIKDSIEYSVKGTYVTVDPFQAFEYTGFVIASEEYSQMYEDSVGSKEGYYWWGGLSSDIAHVDNLDSISLTITVIPDGQVGEFELQYAMGTLDYWERTPVAVISDMMPITITEGGTNVNAPDAQAMISMYPIPAYRILNIDAGVITSGTIQLFDITGRMVSETLAQSGINRIDVAQFEQGLYIVKILTPGFEYSQKVFITSK